LSDGDLEITGRMPWSSNATFLVSVSCGEVAAPAIYKPEAGERPLHDFPGGLWRREVGAFELSQVLGLRIVPETIERDDGPLGEGSVQRFVDADFNEHYFTLLERDELREELRLIAGFDLLANNADRKGGHLLIDPDGHLWGIDNGLCFHSAPKLRTVMWDFAGEEVPAKVVALAESVIESFPPRLSELLSAREQQALVERAEDVIDDPYFPAPDESRRAWPWPLV
jgi:uncharacterized repeat protein (TIGR03843 family)